MSFGNSVQLGVITGFSQPTDGPQEIAVGDFNGDGRQDFVVTRVIGEGVSGTTFSFMLGQDDGTWLDQTSSLFAGAIPGTVYAPRIAVADLNGDGATDVFVPDFGEHSISGTPGTNQVWLSNGKGQMYVASTVSVTNRAHGVAWGDIDGDRDVDVVVNNVNPHADLVLINDGHGSFTDNQKLLPASLRATVGVSNSDWHPWSLISDLTNDGKSDLVLGGTLQTRTGNTTENTPSLVLINSGKGSYASSATYPLPQTPLNPSLSEILCVRHNMLQRSMYAKQDEQEETGGDVAAHPRRSD